MKITLKWDSAKGCAVVNVDDLKRLLAEEGSVRVIDFLNDCQNVIANLQVKATEQSRRHFEIRRAAAQARKGHETCPGSVNP